MVQVLQEAWWKTREHCALERRVQEQGQYAAFVDEYIVIKSYKIVVIDWAASKFPWNNTIS